MKPLQKKKQIGILVFAGLLFVLVWLILFCLPKATAPALRTWGVPLQVTREDGTTLSASPAGMVLCEDGSLLVCDSALHVIWRVSENSAEIVAGKLGAPTADGGVLGGYVDADAKNARFNTPTDILPYQDGYLISDSLNRVLRYYDPIAGAVVTFAGTGAPGQTDGTLERATFASPAGMCMDRDGNVYVADTLNHVIRKVDRSGYVSTFLGSVQGFADGSFDVARLSYPVDIVCEEDEFYIADRGNRAVRAVQSGELVTLCGADPELLGSVEQIAFLPEAVVSLGDSLCIADSALCGLRTLHGETVEEWIAPSAGGSDFLPTALETDGTRLFVASASSSTIEVLDI